MRRNTLITNLKGIGDMTGRKVIPGREKGSHVSRNIELLMVMSSVATKSAFVEQGVMLRNANK